MPIKKIKKKYNLTNADLANVFELSEDSWNSTSAKKRYERATVRLEKIFTKKNKRDGMEDN